MRVIGVTGRLGSGKSTLCKILNRRYGVPVIDADAIGHEALEKGGVIPDLLAARFGGGVLSPDGGIDRARLASIVFADEAALSTLNAIVHPWIVERILDTLRALRVSGGVDIVLIDAALLLLWTDKLQCDRIVWVRSGEAVAVRRMRDRGMEEEDAGRRLGRQPSEEKFRARADWCVDNDGSLDDLEREAERLWEWLRESQ